MGIRDRIGKLKEGLTRTREGIVGKVATLLLGRPVIDEALLEQLEEILIGADVGAGTSGEVIESIRRRVKEEGSAGSSGLLVLLKEEIIRQLSVHSPGANGDPLAIPDARPYVILVVGINGVGKTTTIGKLAHRYTSRGQRVLIAAADTFRAAAHEQLEIWAQRAGAELISQSRGSDPAAVAFDAVMAARTRNSDVVIIDTAGRLHTKVNLMEELKKIRRVVARHDPSFPHEVLLVIDASTGQNGLQQARQFASSVGVTGVVLTKLDGTAKGGIILAISRELNIPVKFIGVGESIDDLESFDRDAFVEALFAP